MTSSVGEGRGASALWRFEFPTYAAYYDPIGGGLASLVDGQGRDWLSFRPGSGPRGEYRGLPNLVHRPGGHSRFHAGYTGQQACTSTRVADHEICGEAPEGWRLRWRFQACGFTCALEAAPPGDPCYWFLYEGTPGGSWEPDRCAAHFADGSARPLTDDWELSAAACAPIAFTAPGETSALGFSTTLQPETVASYFPMDGMTVFGYGRALKSTIGELTEPRAFAVAFGATPQAARKAAQNLLACAGNALHKENP